jgi:ferredoxin
VPRGLHLRRQADALHPPDECVDCGACEPVCPVEAIFYEDDTPEEWKDYYAANVDFFDDLGSPGGAPRWARSTRTTR